jgi:hypothetical protein
VLNNIEAIRVTNEHGWYLYCVETAGAHSNEKVRVKIEYDGSRVAGTLRIEDFEVKRAIANGIGRSLHECDPFVAAT